MNTPCRFVSKRQSSGDEVHQRHGAAASLAAGAECPGGETAQSWLPWPGRPRLPGPVPGHGSPVCQPCLWWSLLQSQSGAHQVQASSIKYAQSFEGNFYLRIKATLKASAHIWWRICSVISVVSTRFLCCSTCAAVSAVFSMVTTIKTLMPGDSLSAEYCWGDCNKKCTLSILI